MLFLKSHTIHKISVWQSIGSGGAQKIWGVLRGEGWQVMVSPFLRLGDRRQTNEWLFTFRISVDDLNNS
jgi:hypothetical protein